MRGRHYCGASSMDPCPEAPRLQPHQETSCDAITPTGKKPTGCHARGHHRCTWRRCADRDAHSGLQPLRDRSISHPQMSWTIHYAAKGAYPHSMDVPHHSPFLYLRLGSRMHIFTNIPAPRNSMKRLACALTGARLPSPLSHRRSAGLERSEDVDTHDLTRYTGGLYTSRGRGTR